MGKKKKVCIVTIASVDLDNRLKKTIQFLKDLNFDISIVTYRKNMVKDPQNWPCEFVLNNSKYFVEPSNNRIWAFRVLWNIFVFNPASHLFKYSLPPTGLGLSAIKLNPDLFYFIGIDSVPEALRVLRKTKKPVIFDSYEYFPKLLKSAIYFNGKLKNMFYNFCEKILVKNSRCTTIVVNETIADGYEEIYKCELPKVIHNCVLETVDEIREHEGISFYFQSYLRPTYNIENMIDAFSLVEGDAKLVIQGTFINPDYKEKLSNYIIDSKRKNDIFLLPPCDYDEVVKEAAKYDVGVNSVSAFMSGIFNESCYHATPNKLYCYASAGLCLALPDYPINRKILEKYKAGVVFNPDDISDFAKALQTLVDSPEMVKEMRKNSLCLGKMFSFDNEMNHFRSIVAEALSKGEK